MPSKAETARALARFHLQFDPEIEEIVCFSAVGDTDLAPIRLLEINPATVPSGIVPVYFGSSERAPFPSIIIELTPEEYARLGSTDLQLPPDWQHGEILFSRSGENVVSGR